MTPLDATPGRVLQVMFLHITGREAGCRRRCRHLSDGDIETEQFLPWMVSVFHLGAEPGHNGRLGVSSRSGCRAGGRLRGPRYPASGWGSKTAAACGRPDADGEGGAPYSGGEEGVMMAVLCDVRRGPRAICSVDCLPPFAT